MPLPGEPVENCPYRLEDGRCCHALNTKRPYVCRDACILDLAEYAAALTRGLDAQSDQNATRNQRASGRHPHSPDT